MPRFTLTPDQQAIVAEALATWAQDQPNPIRAIYDAVAATNAELRTLLTPVIQGMRSATAATIASIDSATQQNRTALTAKLASIDTLAL